MFNFINPFTFRGRLRRLTYWSRLVGMIIFFGALNGAVIAAFHGVDTDARIGVVATYLIALLIYTWSFFAMSARRMHDRDKSGWLSLLWLLPVIGWLWFGVEALLPGTKGPNRFGDKRK